MRLLFLLFEIMPRLPAHWKIYLWNFYPPFLGAGIRIEKVSPDFTFAELSLRLRWWNRNYIGSLFGGSIYSMCDPMHMVLLIQLLGPDYVVRDKGAEIRFLKKGTGKVRAVFEISPQKVAEIWNDPAEVQERKFLARVQNEAGETIAEISKSLHIRRKSAKTKNTE